MSPKIGLSSTTSGRAGCPWTSTRPTDLGNWGRYIGRAAKNCRSYSRPQPACLSIGWTYPCSWPMHNCWQTLMIPLGIVGRTSY